MPVKVQSVTPGKDHLYSIVLWVATGKIVKFYNLRYSEVCSEIDSVMWKQPRNAYGVN